ncbi:hypothetical protein BpHYR1_040445 [Brachionus plicatilis]|uniref:Uncharacterized protein n=1 Tax=Brachionus plicatilis TaxID=10195 RepID=A0A3M7QX94_BRAPC|nr:hypothetical protein BpHYR1_040445 [Brachionus plicatilis]
MHHCLLGSSLFSEDFVSAFCGAPFKRPLSQRPLSPVGSTITSSLFTIDKFPNLSPIDTVLKSRRAIEVTNLGRVSSAKMIN